MTLREYRIELGWTQNQLAQEARIARSAVRKAESGEVIRPASAKAIADAFSRALGRPISVRDIEGLNIQ